MSKVAIQGNASGTGTFTIAAPNSNTDRTLTLPDEAGTVLTSASDLPAANITGSITQNSGPAFYVWRNGNVGFSASTWTKILLNTVEFNVEGGWDTSNYQFKPATAGYYLISVGAFHDYNTATAGSCYTSIVKNGNVIGTIRIAEGNASYNYGMHPVSKLVYLNGSTDYVELHVYTSNSNAYLNGGSENQTWMTGALIRAA